MIIRGGLAVVQVGVLIVLALDASIMQHAHAFSLDDFMDSLKSMAGSNGTDFRAKFGLVGQPSAGNLWMAQRQTAASSALDPVTVPSDLNTIPTLRRTYGELFFKNDTRRRDKAIDAQFEAMDKNDDGTLTTDEYRQAMLALVERLVDHGEDEHDPDDHDQDKHVRAPRTNEAALVDGLLGGNTTISGTFRAFDANSDGNVTRKEYSDSAMELWERSVVLMPALCEETSARLAVCPQLDMNATVSGLKEGVTMTYGEVQWIEDAQCRIGFSATGGYTFQKCVMKSTCASVSSCFAQSMAIPVSAFVTDIRPAPSIDLSTATRAADSVDDVATRNMQLWQGLTIGAVYASLTATGVLTLLGVSWVSTVLFGWLKAMKDFKGLAQMLGKKLPGFLSKVIDFIARRILKTAVVVAFEIFIAVGTIFSILLMMFGVVGILNLIQMSHVVPSTFDALHMPKVDFSGRIVRHELPPSEPACEMFAYWPKRCQPQIIPGTGLRMNRTAPGQALRGSKVCDHGGELWSMDACRAFVGIGDDWTAPCGFAGLGCRPMCYKVNVDECNALARNTSTATAAMTTEGALFRYANSTSFLNPWAPGQPSRMNPYLFTVGGSPSTGQAFAVLDLRPVDQLRQCEEYCNRWTPSGDCRAYVVQAPSKDYGMSMKCTLLGMRAVAGEEPVIKDYREILGDGRNGLADDDRWAPFVVAVRNSVFA